MDRESEAAVQVTAGVEPVEMRSATETESAGRALAQELSGGEVILLIGPLGAGKSVYARGIGSALGMTGWRGSPTFNLVHEYPTRPHLYHADVYRLSPPEIEDLGLEEYVRSDSILLIEWADRDLPYLSLLSPRTYVVELSHSGETSRLLMLRRPSEPA